MMRVIDPRRFNETKNIPSNKKIPIIIAIVILTISILTVYFVVLDQDDSITITNVNGASENQNTENDVVTKETSTKPPSEFSGNEFTYV